MEKIPAAEDGEPPRLGKDLPADERKALLTERIKAYSQRVYKRVTGKPVTDTRIAGICQRENGFYIDTVRSFRDRRYEYKGLVKRWKTSLAAASSKVCTCHHSGSGSGQFAETCANGRCGWGRLGASVYSAQPAQGSFLVPAATELMYTIIRDLRVFSLQGGQVALCCNSRACRRKTSQRSWKRRTCASCTTRCSWHTNAS